MLYLISSAVDLFRVLLGEQSTLHHLRILYFVDACLRSLILLSLYQILHDEKKWTDDVDVRVQNYAYGEKMTTGDGDDANAWTETSGV